jgi:hypothetical protein
MSSSAYHDGKPLYKKFVGPSNIDNNNKLEAAEKNEGRGLEQMPLNDPDFPGWSYFAVNEFKKEQKNRNQNPLSPEPAATSYAREKARAIEDNQLRYEEAMRKLGVNVDYAPDSAFSNPNRKRKY